MSGKSNSRAKGQQVKQGTTQEKVASDHITDNPNNAERLNDQEHRQ